MGRIEFITAGAASLGTPFAGEAYRACVAIGALFLAACGPQPERPLQGYVEGQYVRVAAAFGGTLQQLAVQRVDEIRAAEADARAAREALAQADWRLAQRAITSPAAGRVHDTHYVVGDFVPAGSPVASVLPPGNVLVRFYVPEPVLGRLQPGQAVRVACDGCAEPLVARIAFISDRAEYTPPVLYSRDNRAKLVYRVEARPAAADAAKLHPGQPVDVTLPDAR
jgi:multidrug efflux pump subunit AcrA (membrane-fusion protein)